MSLSLIIGLISCMIGIVFRRMLLVLYDHVIIYYVITCDHYGRYIYIYIYKQILNK